MRTCSSGQNPHSLARYVNREPLFCRDHRDRDLIHGSACAMSAFARVWLTGPQGRMPALARFPKSLMAAGGPHVPWTTFEVPIAPPGVSSA